MRRPLRRSSPPPPPPPKAPDVVRFSCPCGAALKIPADRVGGHGICPKCKRRLQLGNPKKAGDTRRFRPKELGEKDDHSGKTFILEEPFRIEDHFKEMAPPPVVRLPFRCPCGRKLATSSANVDKKARCPHCGARLLLVGKTSRAGKLEIHPLALEVPSSGDTMILDA